MAPQTAKSLMKEFRASFRRKKVVVEAPPKTNGIKEANEDELSKLVELKETMGEQLPPLYSDADLLSFLRARSLNVKEAETLLKLDESAKRLLSISDFQPPEDLCKYSFTGVIGFDKDGSIVRVVNIGYGDIKGIMNTMSTIECLKTLIWLIEKDAAKLQLENKKTGRNNTQFVHIVNLENLTMSQITYKPAFDSAFQALKLVQDHYHDAIKNVYFINAPPFFSSVFKLFHPVIQESLHKRIKIFDQGNFKEELLNHIDADILPKFLGGDRVDSHGDPQCGEFVAYGGVVPESCYATNFLDVDDSDVVVANVPAGATLNFRYPVRKVGSILRWHIQGKDNDIGIALYREPFQTGIETPRTRKKKKEEDMSRFEPLTPVIRSQCHICPEEGSAVLWFTGNIILHFDNTYSWMNSKEVFFKVTVRSPTDTGKNFSNSADHAGMSLDKMTIAC